jgi:hypothetical protein
MLSRTILAVVTSPFFHDMTSIGEEDTRARRRMGRKRKHKTTRIPRPILVLSYSMHMISQRYPRPWNSGGKETLHDTIDTVCRGLSSAESPVLHAGSVKKKTRQDSRGKVVSG